MQRSMNRRRFLSGSLAGGAGLVILGNPASAWSYQANQKLNVALVGVGGRGTWFVDTIPRMENVVALCDVNQQKISEAMKHWEETGKRYATSPNDWERKAGAEFRRLAETKPKTFADFRKMLDEMGKQIDAVVVATPDHSHAVASAAAIKAGKPVFCEKPLTRTLSESRALRELARKHKVATSMGNQGTYSGAFRRALELIRNGALGQIKEIHVWNDGGGADRKQPPKGEEPVPEGLQWDLWLGPAAQRPFHHEWMQRHLVARVRHLPVGQLGLAHRQPCLHGDAGPRTLADGVAPGAAPGHPHRGEEHGHQPALFPAMGDRRLGDSRPRRACRRSRSPGTTARPPASARCWTARPRARPRKTRADCSSPAP